MARTSTDDPLSRLSRLVTWPWRRAVLEVNRRGHRVYGWGQPHWWPERLGGWPGPRHPHDNRSVVIFAGTDRFEFLPAVSDGYRGHAHHGTLRPDVTDVEACLVRLNLPTGAARALAVISSFEGGFDAIQTWDRGKFAWGFIQFTATGGLPRLLHNLKMNAPAVFDECFVSGGIDVDPGGITIRVNGRTLRGRRAHNRLHDDPSLWRMFLLASRLGPVQDMQVRTAYDTYYAHPLEQVVALRDGRLTLGALFAENEYGRAIVCDRAVNRGVRYALEILRTAARQSDARGVRDAPAVLARVRALERRDGWRLDALAQAIPPAVGDRDAILPGSFQAV
jgi:hypothetical protein